jgi:hypothetical protein
MITTLGLTVFTGQIYRQGVNASDCRSSYYRIDLGRPNSYYEAFTKSDPKWLGRAVRRAAATSLGRLIPRPVTSGTQDETNTYHR